MITSFADHIAGSSWGSMELREEESDTISDWVRNHSRELEEIAKWHIEMERVTFPLVGSLEYGIDDRIAIGPVVTPVSILRSPQLFMGPFETAHEFYVAYFDQVLAHIRKGIWVDNLTVAGDKDEDLLVYLAVLEAKSLISKRDELKQGPWYMVHPDSNGGHLMFDHEGRLTGVLDWEWQVHPAFPKNLS